MAQKSPTTFQKDVLAVMCKVPAGKVITYGDISIKLCGNKSKSIAIGSALKYWWHHHEYTDDWGLHRAMANNDLYEKGHRSEEELQTHPNKSLMKKFRHPIDGQIYWGRTAYLRQKEGYYRVRNLKQPTILE